MVTHSSTPVPGLSTHRLLIKEPPLQVLPSLAVAIGLNEALFIQQVHYWLTSSTHEYEGRRWVYNTLDGWQKQFPFFTMSTLRRTIDSLREKQLLLTGNFNTNGQVRTLYYSIDYDALDQVDPFVDFNMPFVQNEQMHLFKMSISNAQNEQMLIEQRLTTETTNRDYVKQQQQQQQHTSTNGHPETMPDDDAAKAAAALLDGFRRKRGQRA